MIKNIKNIKELREQRLLLKAEIAANSQALKQDLLAIEDQFKPLVVGLKFIKNMFTPSHSKNLAAHGAGILVKRLTKFVFRNQSWPVRILLTYISKNAADKYVAAHASEWMASIMNKVKQFIRPENGLEKSEKTV